MKICKFCGYCSDYGELHAPSCAKLSERPMVAMAVFNLGFWNGRTGSDLKLKENHPQEPFFQEGMLAAEV